MCLCVDVCVRNKCGICFRECVHLYGWCFFNVALLLMNSFQSTRRAAHEQYDCNDYNSASSLHLLFIANGTIFFAYVCLYPRLRCEFRCQLHTTIVYVSGYQAQRQFSVKRRRKIPIDCHTLATCRKFQTKLWRSATSGLISKYWHSCSFVFTSSTHQEIILSKFGQKPFKTSSHRTKYKWKIVYSREHRASSAKQRNRD